MTGNTEARLLNTRFNLVISSGVKLWMLYHVITTVWVFGLWVLWFVLGDYTDSKVLQMCYKVHRRHCSNSTVPSSPAQRRCSCYREGRSRNDQELQTRGCYIRQGCILLKFFFSLLDFILTRDIFVAVI